MAKPKGTGNGKGKDGKPHTHKEGFCWNCGQAAAGATFIVSLVQTAAFCCRCGTKLHSNGTCRLPACPFYKLRPQC